LSESNMKVALSVLDEAVAGIGPSRRFPVVVMVAMNGRSFVVGRSGSIRRDSVTARGAELALGRHREVSTAQPRHHRAPPAETRSMLGRPKLRVTGDMKARGCLIGRAILLRRDSLTAR